MPRPAPPTPPPPPLLPTHRMVAVPLRAGKEALKSGLNIPGVAESYDEGGNLKQARYAQGLGADEELPPSA